MIQRHLFDAGNVIEYDSDDWRICPCKNCIRWFLHIFILVSLTIKMCYLLVNLSLYNLLSTLANLTTIDHTVYMLLLHSLSHILSQSASANTVRLAVLEDKQMFSSITGSVTTAVKPITDDKTKPVTLDCDESEEEEKVTLQPSSSPGQKMDVSQQEVSSTEIGSQVASLKMSDSGINMPSASRGDSSGSGSSAQFTLAMLSNALQNVNQSLGVPPGDKQREETTTTVPQSDTDGYVDVPGEKRPRLDTHEVTTLQQSTLPQDIHDKLHSNIR